MGEIIYVFLAQLKNKHYICTMTEYEAKKRLEWFIDGYFIHCLGSSFANLTTERICELYNVELDYFRPYEV